MRINFLTKRKTIAYSFLLLLFGIQTIGGYIWVKSSYFWAQNYVDTFYLFSYFITLIAVSYTISCYILGLIMF